MKSPNQWRPKSTPKKVTLEAGAKIMHPMGTGRASPATKTVAKIYSGYGGKK